MASWPPAPVGAVCVVGYCLGDEVWSEVLDVVALVISEDDGFSGTAQIPVLIAESR